MKVCPLEQPCLKQDGVQLVCSIVGTCIELCSGDWDCDLGEHCVSTGCGHACAADWGQVKASGPFVLSQTLSNPGRPYTWPWWDFPEMGGTEAYLSVVSPSSSTLPKKKKHISQDGGFQTFKIT